MPLVGKQLQSVQLATSSMCIWEGSVRSSKTICSLIAWLRFVRQGPAGNLLMVGKTERTLKRNVIDPLTEMVGPSRCRHVMGTGEVWLLGRRIYTAGANDEKALSKIQGLTLAGAYVDEISTMPESYWMMLRSRLSVNESQLFGTSNPDSPRHWLKRDFLDRASMHLTHEGKVVFREGDDALDLARFSFRLRDNPHLPESYIAGLEQEFTGLWRKRYVEGLWVVAEGAIYDMWDMEQHVIDLLPPIQSWLCVSIDYGTTNPFDAILLGVGVDGIIYAVAEWRWDSRAMQHQLTDAEYSERIRGWLANMPVPAAKGLRGVIPQYWVIDPSAASFRVQAHYDGMTAVEANNNVLDGIRLVSMLLTAGKLRVHRSCTNLIDEFSSYAWDDKAAEKGEDKPIKVDDHSVDAIRYGVATTRGGWQSRVRLLNAVAA